MPSANNRNREWGMLYLGLLLIQLDHKINNKKNFDSTLSKVKVKIRTDKMYQGHSTCIFLPMNIEPGTAREA